MHKIGILYICTGEYTVFWPEFYLSSEQYFLKNSEVHYFVFTDSETIAFQSENSRIHVIHQEAYGWPFSTLLRFSVFLGAREQLEPLDYVFFFNANAQFISPIQEEKFLPDETKGEKLLVVQHPGFYNKKMYEFTYDRNPRCSAYIPFWQGHIYICGGINGGKTHDFLKMCECLSGLINQDLKQDIIPAWHDESHINKYILGRKDVKVLSPAYCYPEDWDIPYDGRILIRNKKKYINISQIRKDSPETKLSIGQRFVNYTVKMIAKLLTWFRNVFSGETEGVIVHD